MTEPSWGLGKRIAFRFGFVLGVLAVFPFPLSLIPKTGWLTEPLGKPFEWGVDLLARHVLGLADLPTAFNGSGDRTVDYVQTLLIAILAVLGAIVWSIVDRRRKAYPRLAGFAWVGLRYAVCYAMLSYGFAKILKSQFPDLRPRALEERVGEMSPMGLLWIFMGYSLPYTVFAGLAEAIGGALLLWRRTVTLGALLVIAVMTNVVLLNFCYDVPVKLYSMQLLIMTGLIALPGARRVVAAAMGYAVAEAPPRVRMSRRRERIRVAAKLVMVAAMACNMYLEFSSGPNRNSHVHELYGIWTVDGFAADGVDHPPLTSDPVRWGTLVGNPRSMTIRLITGERERPITVNYGVYDWTVDAASHTITVTLDAEKKLTETWKYTRPAPERLVIDGVHGGKLLHVALHREPDPLLITRGFHWINEVPFNR